MTQRGLTWCWVIVTSLAMAPAFAEEVRVAMATNFVPPFQEISIAFEQATGHHVQVTAGSSGHLYAQIKNGAPFDVFFSAERERPKLLEEGEFGVKGTRFTYAIGRLVLWSPHADLVKGAETLLSKNYPAWPLQTPETPRTASRRCRSCKN